MAIAKAVILCAGEGTRLRPLTSLCPKHLLPVAGQPLLGWILQDLAAVGIRQVGLVVGYHAEAIEEHIADGSQWGVTATYLTQPQPLGLADAVNTAREFVGQEPFVVYLGDNVLEGGLSDFLNRFEDEQANATIVVKEVDDPRQFGVVEMQGPAVVRLVEKPAQPRSNLAIVGVYAFKPVIFEGIAQIAPSARGEYEITDAIQWVLDNEGKVTAHKLAGFWGDAASPEDLLGINQFYLDRIPLAVSGRVDDNTKLQEPVGVGSNTRVSGSDLTGPSIIGDNCVIENCSLGPYVSVSDGCHIVNSNLRNCIIRENCHLQATELADSVVGQQVEIVGAGRGQGPPLSTIVGDTSRIRIA